MDEDAKDAYDEDAEKSLRYVKQLGEWTHRILVVSGARGPGRAALFQLLSNHVEPGSRAARVNASGLASPLQFWGAVAFGLGLEAQDSASAPDLEAKVLAHSRELAESGHLDILLVDNADQLPESVIESLLALMEKSLAFDSLRLVLFGDENFSQGFDLMIAAFAPEVGWHHTPVTHETVEATERHLRSRMARAPGRAQVDVDVARSDPGARQWAIPWIHIVAGGVIALVLLAMLVDFDALFGTEDEFAKGIPTPLEALEARDSAGRQAASTTPGLDVEVETRPGATAPETPRESEETAPEDAERIAMPRASPAAGGSSADASEVQAPSSGDATAAEDVTQAGAQAEATPAANAATSGEAGEAVGGAAPTSDEAAPVGGEESAPAVSAETEKVAVQQATSAPEHRGPAWILAQNPGAYVLQLFGVSSRARLDRFLDAQPPGEPFAYFETRRGGKPWFVVLYGVYEDRASAQRRASELPSSVAGSSWVRPFRDVQRDVERAQKTL